MKQYIVDAFTEQMKESLLRVKLHYTLSES